MTDRRYYLSGEPSDPEARPMFERCECCGHPLPGAACPRCGRAHSPAVDGGCESCQGTGSRASQPLTVGEAVQLALMHPRLSPAQRAAVVARRRQERHC